MGIIAFQKENSGEKTLENHKKMSKGLGIEEKRLRYAMDVTEEVRKQWLERRGN